MASNHLSILFEKGGLSFLVTKDNKVLEAGKNLFDSNLSLEKNLDKAFIENLYLKQDYQHVSISFLGKKFIFVPNEYYDGDNEKWLGFNAEIDEDDYLQVTDIPLLNSVLIYAIPFDIVQLAKSNFKGNEVKHTAEIFFNQFEIEGTSNQAFLIAHQQQFEIIVVQNNHLQLYNIFDYKTKEDITYHLLNILKQLKIDPNNIELYYYGISDELTLKMIMNFIRHVIPATSDLERMKYFTLIENLQYKS